MTPNKTGWPMPELMQDDHRGLFKWFASKLGSRRLVRETCCERNQCDCDQGRKCPERAGNVYPELIEDEAVYAFDDVMHALRYGLAVAALSCAAFLGSLALALVLSHFRL